MSGQFNFILILYRPANFVGFTQLLENPCRNSCNRLRSTHYLLSTPVSSGVMNSFSLSSISTVANICTNIHLVLSGL